MTIKRIRLIREVNRPSGRGPGNGQFALQRALAARRFEGLILGGRLEDDEIPWFWCWLDREEAVRRAVAARPFIVGPNVLFQNSRFPGRAPGERAICRAASCRLMFTESAWYRALIDRQRGPENRAPIVVWPYPIEPRPGPPLPARFDLLLYLKSGYRRSLVARLRKHYRRTALVHYGRYRREELAALAQGSRAGVYLSDDDRGPLALAEMLLAGCPAVGIPRGAPFIEPGKTGFLIDRFDPDSVLEAVKRCHTLDRRRVAAAAAERFDTGRIVETVVSGLRGCLER